MFSRMRRKMFKLTEKQREAARLIAQKKIVLLEGGSRSGKTFLALRVICKRALEKPAHHLVARFRFNHAKQSICHQTMPAVLESLNLKKAVKLNKTDWFYEFPNGSTVWIGGLDDKDRTEKILGNEYATIFLNEASQISYPAYETIITRLNPPEGMRGRILIDYNPPSINHWGYKIFHRGELPDGRTVDMKDYGKIRMNPGDNIENISTEYLETLNTLSESKRKRYLHGEYSLDSGTLWRRAWIKYREELPDMQRIVVGVDPAGTVDGDEIGIIIAGKAAGEYYVLDDYSMHGTPQQWAAEVAQAFVKWRADAVIAEKNYGGDMVESTIRGAKKNINVQLVNATRGKVVRAEPMSALYERGQVYHRIPFNDLEDEMCLYDPAIDKSPNRMDALVWALTELTEGYTGNIAENYGASDLGL